MIPGLSEVAVLFVVILGLAVFTGLGTGLLIRLRRGVLRPDPVPQRRGPEVASRPSLRSSADATGERPTDDHGDEPAGFGDRR